MKTRALILVLAISTIIFSSCEGDIPPEKNVGNITFVITEENTPQTLSGVSIQLFSDDDPSVTPTDRTDASGRCTFSNIPIGSYHLNLSKPGYESKEGLTLRVNGDDNPYKEISLKRATTTLTVAPDVLDFGDNESVVQKAFSLVNPNYEDLTWATLDTDVPWIVSVCDKDGKKSGTIKYNREVAMFVTIDRDALASGNNESTIVILSDYGRAELHVTAVGADRRFPITEITEVIDVDLQTATFKGKVLSVGAPEYEERGFVYSTSTIAEDATEGFTKIPSEMNSGNTFSAAVNGLNKGTTYYVRAYGKNALGLKLSSTYKTFTTIATITSVSTLPVTQIDVVNGRAQFNGTITEVGSPIYSEKGFCYNTSGEPTVSDTKYAVSGTSGGDYYYSCAGLATNTTYYVRAYAIQNDKIYYGTSVSFNTGMSTTGVSTSSATSVTPSSATLNGAIVKVGSPTYSEKGFCYSTSPNPTINSTKKPVGGTGEGNFSLNITGLDYNTTYYYKAYAIQNGIPIYGAEVSFNTGLTPAAVQTESVGTNDIGYTDAEVSFRITNIGDPVCTETGICYSTYTNPTISSNKVKGSIHTYSQSIELTGLRENTTYYFRAYVIQNGKTIYSSELSFTTGTKPSVSTLSHSNLSNPYGMMNMWEVQLNGRVNSVGNPSIKSRGFKYSTSGDPESGGTTESVSGSASGDFSKSLSGLKSNTTYYVRAFVTVKVRGKTEYVYGDMHTFTTSN
ncbi:MAG: carboxypeptidase regulatory-like domain-containing protein [Tyzzerella sp.]|nr:carboxypeptidase regulatory-like domain-containing protein [Tyzzerella sp.]